MIFTTEDGYNREDREDTDRYLIAPARYIIESPQGLVQQVYSRRGDAPAVDCSECREPNADFTVLISNVSTVPGEHLCVHCAIDARDRAADAADRNRRGDVWFCPDGTE